MDISPAGPRGWVRRPRLDAALSAAARSRLTVVTGPPGAGKSTALTSWAQSRAQGSTAWLALEPADNDPARFWARMAVALGLPVPTGREESAGSAWWAGVDGAAVSVLIIDDFQLLTNRRLTDAVGSLMISGSFPVPLVIASRSAPDLRLHRLRMSGELAEIGGDDLRFDVDETRAWLQMMYGPAAANTDAVALSDHTEGWAAGLLMITNARARAAPDDEFVPGPPDASDSVAAYFAREVMDYVSPEEERFLLGTSVLERLSGSLCQAVTGHADARLILGGLADRNLFVFPLDRQGEWFRHHRLFAEFLRARLLREDPSRAHRVGLRAAAWHRRHGDEASALRQLVRAAAYRGVPALVASGPPSRSPGGNAAAGGGSNVGEPEQLYRLARALLHGGRVADGRRWLRRLERAAGTGGAAAAWSGPIEGLWALEASLRGDAAGVLFHCAEARRATGGEGDVRAHAGGAAQDHGPDDGPCRSTDPSLPGLLATLEARAHLWLDRPENTRAILARHFPAGDDERDDHACVGLLALLAARSGRLQDAWMLASRALDSPGQEHRTPMTAVLDALLARAIVLWERHDLDAAARVAVPAAGDSPDPHLFWPLESQLIQIMISRGQASDAMSRLLRLRAGLAGPGWGGPIERRLDVLDIRCRAVLGDRGQAVRALIESPAGCYPTEVLAWADLCAGRPGQAKARLSSPPDLPTSVGAQLQRLTLLARAHGQLGDERAALATLRPALELGEPGGYVTAFVEDAPELVAWLRRIAGPFPDAYLARVAEQAEQSHVRTGGARPHTAAEPLSGREQEILAHLPTHRSQVQIAAQMYVSINTVKTHIRAVYRKLGVSSRSEAVSVARAQQLI